VDFFDDANDRAPAEAGGPPSAPEKRRRPDRRRIRTQRIIILALILFIAVFALAWWARSCQHNHKVSSYRGYFTLVDAAIGNSDALGKQVSAIVQDPTKLSRKQLIQKLGLLSAQQDEIAVRTSSLKPPSALTDEQRIFATGMKVRATGFHQLQALMLGALASKRVGATKIAALDGYFSGPDAYYMDLVYLPSRTTMSKDGVTDVAVPTSTYYLTWKALDPVRVAAMLDSVGKSSKLTGIHGVALLGVTAKTASGDVKLVKGKTNNVQPSADLAFVAMVQNGGNATENNVPVTATLTFPGNAQVKQSATIATIAAGKTQDVTITGFAIPPEALSKVCTLKVTAGPVPGERDSSNNSAQYKLLLMLK
jgi:hypothetical protein